MKKIIVSLLALSFFLFVGCGEEQANGEKGRHEEQIVYRGETKVWDFDNDKQGEIAGGFSNQVTGKDGPGKWEIIKDDTAPSISNIIARHLWSILVIISVWPLRRMNPLMTLS